MNFYDFLLFNFKGKKTFFFFFFNLDKWTALFSCIYVALLKPISALLLTEIL